MPSSRNSDHSQTVAGEEAVAAWLDSLPKLATRSIYDMYSTVKVCIETPDSVTEAHIYMGTMISTVRTWMGETRSKGSGPPNELVDALHLTSDNERPLRKDAVILFDKHSLPRFLLLACGEHQSALSDLGPMCD